MKPVKIPKDKIPLMRAALTREQVGKDAADIVRYSHDWRTFWRWKREPDGWRRQKCSRSGDVLEEFFGPSYLIVEFGRDPDGKPFYYAANSKFTIEHLRKRHSKDLAARRAEPRIDIPEFLSVAHAEHGWGSKLKTFIEETKPMITHALKLSLLLFGGVTDSGSTRVFETEEGCNPRRWEIDRALQDLVADDLITLNRLTRTFILTEKGRVFAAHLGKQPLPVQAPAMWTMPV